MSGAFHQVELHHLGAGAVLHAVCRTGGLVSAPIAFARDIHGGHIDGAPRERVHFGDTFRIGAAPHAVALQGACKFGATVLGHIYANFGLGQLLQLAISAADGINGATLAAMPLSRSIT